MVFNKFINVKKSSQPSIGACRQRAPLPMDPNPTNINILDRIELRLARVYFRIHGPSVSLQWRFREQSPIKISL
jgi:hypothetical protein